MEMTSLIALGVLGILLFLFLIIILWAGRVQTVGPNEVLIISGGSHTVVDPNGNKHTLGFKVVKGGRAFVWPIIERAERLSLELMTLEIQTPEVMTNSGVPVMVDGVAQIKVKSEEFAIHTAAEQFLGKSKSEIMGIAHQTLEGHLRAILGTMEVEEIIKNRDKFASNVQEVSAPDLARMGLVIVSFTIKDIRDKQGYLESLGKKAIAERQRDAAIGQAEAQRDAEIKRSEATAKAVEESSKFNKQAQVTKLANETVVAEAHRNNRIKVAEYEGAVNQKKADADKAYDLQKFKVDQLVRAEELQVTVIAKQKEIEIQQQEIKRRELELVATVERPAEAERKKVETLSQAEQFKLKATAEGEAESARMRGLARADVERAEGTAAADVSKIKGNYEADVRKSQGLAEADIIRAKAMSQAEGVKAMGLAEAETRRAVGLAEAEAMEKKAAAWKSYNEAAISQMFIDKLPEIVRAVSEPLSKTEKIIMISNGGEGVGASKITKEIIDVVTQVPPMLEAVTGIDMREMLGKVKGVTSAAAGEAPKPAPHAPPTGKTKG
ncbi:MAG TPA: SPFH domain-containing protein [Candidatus Ozemobacteraceae bacterium]|nr:SPFH domain-containing protein [Candidatus Ozemobacteraceae bacterium]